MKKFNSESVKNEFKNLCEEVLPSIGSIEQVLEKGGVPKGGAFDKVSENLAEISLAFASMQSEIKDVPEIDILTWKQEFVVWANEFEQMYRNAEWGMADVGGKEYLEAIEEFAKGKIRKLAGLEE